MISIKQIYDIYLRHPKVCKDSREDVSGGIYFSIKGENFDGNLFAMDALQKGAAYAVIDDPSKVDAEDDRLIHVDDALETLQQLATLHREKLDIPVLGITGSNGKTTTKELVGSVLNVKLNVFATPGNYNNHIGIPLSILQIVEEIEIAVLEMGASAVGEIESYCQYAQPDYGIITNIGKDHLEGFGSIEGVKKAKGELYDYLAQKEGMIFINMDEAHLPEMAKDIKRKFSYYQSKKLKNTETEFTARLISAQPEIVCEFRDQEENILEVHSPLMGRHNFNNVMTAMAVGAYFGLSGSQIKEGVERYKPLNNRSQIIRKDQITYLLDAYNANPTSMAFMIKTLAGFENGKKGLILGEMLEMGTYSQREHQAIVDMISELQDVAFVYLVGEAFINTKSPEHYRNFKDTAALKSFWDPQKHANTTVLIKGSRRWKLEELID